MPTIQPLNHKGAVEIARKGTLVTVDVTSQGERAFAFSGTLQTGHLEQLRSPDYAHIRSSLGGIRRQRDNIDYGDVLRIIHPTGWQTIVHTDAFAKAVGIEL